jgi:hypothetical protein
MDIRTDPDSQIEAYIFERHVQGAGITTIKAALSMQPGVKFVGQFVGAFTLFARVVANDLSELQGRIENEYWRAGIRSDVSLNLTANRPAAPKRQSPDICAMICCQTSVDPFGLLSQLDDEFLDEGAYGAAVVNAPDFDVLVDLGADTVEDVLDRILRLRKIQGITRTATAFADLGNGNAIRN